MENYKKFKLDTMVVEYKKIGFKKYMIYLQYNNLNSQTNFIIDLDSISVGIKNIFTKRQLQFLIKKLENEEKKEDKNAK